MSRPNITEQKVIGLRKKAEFLAALAKAEVTWMSGLELGLTLAEPEEVLMWPYLYENEEKMALVLIHEIVHHVWPDLAPDGAVWAKAQYLLKKPWCRQVVFKKLTAALLVAIHDIKKRYNAYVG